MAIVCPTNDSTGLCVLLDSVGAGLGIFIQYMATALPPLLIILGIIAGVVAVVLAIATVIKSTVVRGYRTA